MKKPTIDYDFLLRCLQSPTDTALQHELNARLSDPDFAQAWTELQQIWQQAPAAASWEGIDAASATRRFSARLEQSTPVRRLGWKYFAAAAAVASTVAVAAWLWKTEPAQQQWLTKTTGSYTDSLLLPDHSKIYLNQFATIRYPASFQGSETRAVELQQGEAFFDIQTNATQPFIVNSGAATVRVLGTSFNVKMNGQRIAVAVSTGKVALERRSDNKGIILLAGKQGVYNALNQETQALPEDLNSLAWRTHRLKFVDTDITEVCNTLSEYYHVNIIADNKKQRKLNATFQDNSLEEVLQTLTLLYDYHIVRKGNAIYIK